jgi:DNA helicase-2/ATP-dependent DNA helicase PcrA
LFTVTEKYDEEGKAAGVLEKFLEEVGLLSAEDRESRDLSQKVHLMTMHAAKGLEFDTVFLVGMEEGLFPHSRSLMDRNELEEERRLAYVGITRARKNLTISFAGSRRIYNQWQYNIPSRFISEFPKENVEVFKGF